MRSILLATAIAAVAPAAFAQDAVNLQLKWVTQAQFAGYFAALDQGFYEEEGLDVTILPGGPDVAPTQVIAGGGADVIVEWMPAALAAREQGVPLVNIAQVFDRSGMQLTCWADSGIATPADFPNHTLGVWFSGNEYPFLSWMSQLGVATDGRDEDGVEVLKQGFNVDPLIQRQADCISTMTYNEYGQVLDAGVTPEELINFRYEDQGVATLEDGLWVLEENLQDPAFVERMGRFVRASMRGWEWAAANPEAAAQIVIDNDETGAQTIEHQTRMMGEIAQLITDTDPALDPAAYERTVATLMAGGSDPVINAMPEGAWTSVVTDAAAAE